ncbi:MAG: GNAT family N-acetyltransferase [Sandaracinaceae bacterium]|nr:GNAT family N-acetyltransferase [Sandaracinaceae bacterium]
MDDATPISIRTGRPEDAARAAPLVYSSGPAAFDYVFGARALELLETSFERDEGLFGCGNHDVAELEGRAVGVGAFYDHAILRARSPGTMSAIARVYGLGAPAVLARAMWVAALMPAPAAGELYVAHLGVEPALRGHGVMTRMLERRIALAREDDYRLLALDVARTNPGARRLSSASASASWSCAAPPWARAPPGCRTTTGWSSICTTSPPGGPRTSPSERGRPLAYNRAVPSAGDVLADKYRLIAPLGDPAKGTVWKAEHTTLQTPVAVKFVQRARGEVATKRFLAEAKAAGAVRHQNVVGIIDFGATDEGEPYMILEHLEGETLRARLDRDPPLSAGEVVHIAVHALSGLAAVHDSDIVHRDLRPRERLPRRGVRRSHREAARLRREQVARIGRIADADHGGRRARLAALHLSGAAPRRSRPRPARGSLLGRRDPLRGAGGAPAVPGRDLPRGRAAPGRGRPGARHGAPRARAALRGDRPRDGA